MQRKKRDDSVPHSHEHRVMATVARETRTIDVSIGERIAGLDWARVGHDLDEQGNAVIERLIDAEGCAMLAGLYDVPGLHRSRVVMARHGFGRGEYQYFAYPLPALVEACAPPFTRSSRPSRIAGTRHRARKRGFPAEHACVSRRAATRRDRRGRRRCCCATDAGDYNCLHQDLYGEHVFPLQVTVLLSQPGRDFTGGEFVLTEQRPRMQSRAEVVPLAQGDAVVFAVNQRPVRGPRGVYRVKMRHGVSRVRSGHRHTLGVIFHDAT